MKTKNLKKFFQASKKLEKIQTARRAKEVEEVRLFKQEKESHACADLLEVIDSDQIHLNSQYNTLKAIIAEQQKGTEIKTHDLVEAEQLETEALDMKTGIHDLQLISESSDSDGRTRHTQIKQLPAGHPDVFEHELSDLTETCLQQELEKNNAAVKEVEEEEEPPSQPKHEGPLYLRGRSI